MERCQGASFTLAWGLVRPDGRIFLHKIKFRASRPVGTRHDRSPGLGVLAVAVAYPGSSLELSLRRAGLFVIGPAAFPANYKSK